MSRSQGDTVQPAMSVFAHDNYKDYCDLLAEKDKRVSKVLERYGYPPVWKRENGFEGLLRIILEQQVSLASALAVYKKLKTLVGSIDPVHIIHLSGAELRSCGFSRQKAAYAKYLANEILKNGLDFKGLAFEDDAGVKDRLIKIKGIGNWTCDIYLLICLNRLDIFPMGDLALINAMKENGIIRSKPTKQMILKTTEQFKPYRSVFAMILWHAYIQKRKIKLE